MMCHRGNLANIFPKNDPSDLFSAQISGFVPLTPTHLTPSLKLFN